MIEMILKESELPYTVTADNQLLAQEPVLLQRNGRPVAVLIPFAQYEAFRAWQQIEARRRHRQQELEAFERERVTFEQMKPDLLRTYPGKVVVIYQGRVVQVGDEIAETLMSVYEQFGYVPCYAQRVEEPEHIYHLPHPRSLRSNGP
ncbi:MAG: hypothetical protein AB1791_23485 [Chloroflexota bacterium]